MAGNPDRVPDLHRLADIWEGLGLRVLEMPGWERRGRVSGNTFEVLGCHHTGVPIDTDRILRDGRSDLSGPLCNVALHANGDVILVAAAWPITWAPPPGPTGDLSASRRPGRRRRGRNSPTTTPT
jgi:hypothetical protein